MDSQPPVSRDGFEYDNDEFYVLVQPNHRHRRFAIHELRAILASTSKTPLKDQPAHWYRAQLIHYGLQATDHTDTATQRLLDAMRQKTLEVPAWVQRLERELKKEYHEGQKRQAKEGTARSRKAGRKRKTPTAKKRWDDLANLDCDMEDDDKDDDELSSGLTSATPAPTPRRSGRLGLTISNLNFNFNVAGLVGSPRKSARRNPSLVPVTPVQPVQVEEEEEEAETERQDDAPESSRGRPLPNPRFTLLGFLNGVYNLDSTTAITHNSSLTLCPDPLSIWGAFHLGVVEGVLFIDDPPWTVTPDDAPGCPFIWRARDLDTGLGIYGARHSGAMRYLGGGRIDGVFFSVPDGEGGWCECAFWGVRKSPWFVGRLPRDVASLKRQFENFADVWAPYNDGIGT